MFDHYLMMVKLRLKSEGNGRVGHMHIRVNMGKVEGIIARNVF